MDFILQLILHVTFDPFNCSCFGLKRVIQGCVRIDLYNFDNFLSHQVCTNDEMVQGS